VYERTFGMFVWKQAVYAVVEWVVWEKRSGYGVSQLCRCLDWQAMQDNF
jgi:hypothetical protein